MSVSDPTSPVVHTLEHQRNAIIRKYGLTEEQYERKLQSQPNLLLLLSSTWKGDDLQHHGTLEYGKANHRMAEDAHFSSAEWRLSYSRMKTDPRYTDTENPDADKSRRDALTQHQTDTEKMIRSCFLDNANVLTEIKLVLGGISEHLLQIPSSLQTHLAGIEEEEKSLHQNWVKVIEELSSVLEQLRQAPTCTSSSKDQDPHIHVGPSKPDLEPSLSASLSDVTPKSLIAAQLRNEKLSEELSLAQHRIQILEKQLHQEKLWQSTSAEDDNVFSGDATHEN